MKYSINVYDQQTSEILATKGTDFVSMGTFLKFTKAFETIDTEKTTEETINKVAELVCSAIPSLTIDEAINNCDFNDLIAVFLQIVNNAKEIKQSKN